MSKTLRDWVADFAANPNDDSLHVEYRKWRADPGQADLAVEVVADSYRQNCCGCGVGVGGLHRPSCDVESCPYCGRQLQFCTHRQAKDRPTDDDRLAWTGLWPGMAECIEWGWFARLVPGMGWVPCNKDDRGARPDLNRLLKEARWDRPSKQWVRVIDEKSKSGSALPQERRDPPNHDELVCDS